MGCGVGTTVAFGVRFRLFGVGVGFGGFGVGVGFGVRGERVACPGGLRLRVST